MKMSGLTRVAATAVFFVGVAWASSGGTSNVKGDEQFFAVPDFEKVRQDEADKAAEAVTTSYDEIVANLRAQLRQAKTDDGRTYAAYLLGTLRAQAAVRDLLEVIDFPAGHLDPRDRIGRWGSYPAQDALSKIGVASVQPTLEALGKEDNELRRKLMVMVVLGSYGRKDISLLVLQKAASFAPEEAKARYKKATDMLNGWQIEDRTM
jgi:hypothetical protein